MSASLRASSVPTHFTDPENRLVVQLVMAVSKGLPILPEQIKQATRDQSIPVAAGLSFIREIGEFDQADNLVGLFGLSQKKHPHRFEVSGRILYTWCALDALYLPGLLGETAVITSRCPANGSLIQLAVSPKGVEKVEPPASVLSLVLPSAVPACLTPVQNVWARFCCKVHFVSSSDAAVQWLPSDDKSMLTLPVAAGFELGCMTFTDLFTNS